MARRTTATGAQGATTRTDGAAKTPRTRRATTPNPAAEPQSAPAQSPAATTERSAPPRREPTVEQIRQRAYEIFLARGSHGGSAESDWLQAERELRAER